VIFGLVSGAARRRGKAQPALKPGGIFLFDTISNVGEQTACHQSDARVAINSLHQLNAVAQRHLDDQEQNVVPLAAVTLTQQEWDAMGKHGFAQMPRNKRRIAFGMILDPLDEADRACMKGFLPAPVRMLYPLLVERPGKSTHPRCAPGPDRRRRRPHQSPAARRSRRDGERRRGSNRTYTSPTPQRAGLRPGMNSLTVESRIGVR
jgi:hypothetical protein